jgi:co-chaperonin GroES (HSP10)
MKALRHQPTRDWIIAKKLPLPETPSLAVVNGLHRPTQRAAHHYAVVVAIGPGRPHPQTGYTPAPPCAVGDLVMVRDVAGDPESIDGTEYHWFIPDEIMAVVREETLIS